MVDNAFMKFLEGVYLYQNVTFVCKKTMKM